MCCKMVWKFCEIWKILWELASRWAKFFEISSQSVRYGMYGIRNAGAQKNENVRNKSPS